MIHIIFIMDNNEMLEMIKDSDFVYMHIMTLFLDSQNSLIQGFCMNNRTKPLFSSNVFVSDLVFL